MNTKYTRKFIIHSVANFIKNNHTFQPPYPIIISNIQDPFYSYIYNSKPHTIIESHTNDTYRIFLYKSKNNNVYK